MYLKQVSNQDFSNNVLYTFTVGSLYTYIFQLRHIVSVHFVSSSVHYNSSSSSILYTIK